MNTEQHWIMRIIAYTGRPDAIDGFIGGVAIAIIVGLLVAGFLGVI